MKNKKALHILKVQEGAQVEHLLKLDFYYMEAKDELANALKIMQTASSWFDNVIAYTGAIYQPQHETETEPNTRISEMCFRTSEVMSQDDVFELLECAELEGLLIGYEHKSMVIDEICEIYENLEVHHEEFGVQAMNPFSDDDMLEIFGEGYEVLG